MPAIQTDAFLSTYQRAFPPLTPHTKIQMSNNRLNLIGYMALLLSMTACMAQSEENTPFTTLEMESPLAFREVVVRLCPETDEARAQQRLQQHNLLLHKKVSPLIWTLRWSNGRTTPQVITELTEESATFCIVQPNYQYQSR